MNGRFALAIGNTDYHDTGLAQLTAPGRDVEDFAHVLRDPNICAFDDVKVLLNEPEYIVRGAIEDLFDQKKPDDLLVLYFSGHGVRDELGGLYLAVTNTNRSRLHSTAIKSSFISEAMDQSRSKRQVLILDCCNSGAFAQGSKAATGMSIGTAVAFQSGYGRVILTASDSTQYAWEGDRVIGETDNSLFTHFLIEGLQGDADRNGDGRITVDELYDYAYEKISLATPKQTPSKFSTKQQGEIILRQNIRIEDSKPVPLPDDLIAAIKSSLPYVRQGAVHQLDELLKGKNRALARASKEALQRIAEEDDSRQVSRLASQVLQSFQQIEQAEEERLAGLEAERKAKEEADRLTAQKAEEERLARIEAERKAKEEAKRLAAQKVEEERLAKLEAERKAQVEAERLAKQQAEEERLAKIEAEHKAKEEARRLAAQKAEAERLAKQKAKEELAAKARAEKERKAKETAKQFAQANSAEHQDTGKAMPAVLMLARAKTEDLLASFRGNQTAARAVMFGFGALAVLAIVLIGVRAFSNPGTTPLTETPVLQSTTIPNTSLPTIIPDTPTLNATVPVSGPKLEVASRSPYVDGDVLVAVPAGEFTMGGGGTDNPKHKVTLKDYWIYSTEVTNQQYALCVSLGKCAAPDSNDNPGYSDYKLANDPVTGVTYEQAADYCTFVQGRLPLEAEWEKAAQSQLGGNYPWGKAAPTCDFLNFNSCLPGAASVVNYSKGASYYGALNMAGNVFEWVADWYDAKYYSRSPAENPSGPASGTLRSVRSSSYSSSADQVEVALRSSESPQNHRPDLGFRCVVDDPTYFAPFCRLPPLYAKAATQDAGSLESCPELQIKPVPICNNDIPLTNVKFVGPSESTIDPQDCIPSNNPNLFTCKKKGELVSISAACQLNDLGDPSCLAGYSEQDNLCVANGGASQSRGNCLAGDYNSASQCCNPPTGGTDSSPALQPCPVGTYYAAKANACLPQPVQELITVSYEVAVASSCTSPSGSGGGGGGSGGGGGGGGTGCQATQAQIDNCNAQAPFYSWSSAKCSCEPT